MRADYVRFDTTVLNESLAITGPVSLTLYVSTNATDTDFAAKLTDVYPDGRDMLIQVARTHARMHATWRPACQLR